MEEEEEADEGKAKRVQYFFRVEVRVGRVPRRNRREGLEGMKGGTGARRASSFVCLSGESGGCVGSCGWFRPWLRSVSFVPATGVRRRMHSGCVLETADEATVTSRSDVASGEQAEWRGEGGQRRGQRVVWTCDHRSRNELLSPETGPAPALQVASVVAFVVFFVAQKIPPFAPLCCSHSFASHPWCPLATASPLLVCCPRSSFLSSSPLPPVAPLDSCLHCFAHRV